MSIKILNLGEGGYFGPGGGKGRFYFYGRGDFSDGIEYTKMGSQHPSPDVKTFCKFEPQIWLEIITSRDAKSACF